MKQALVDRIAHLNDSRMEEGQIPFAVVVDQRIQPTVYGREQVDEIWYFVHCPYCDFPHALINQPHGTTRQAPCESRHPAPFTVLQVPSHRTRK